MGKIPVCPKALTNGASILSLTHDRLAAVTRACHGIFTGFHTEEIGKIIKAGLHRKILSKNKAKPLNRQKLKEQQFSEAHTLS